MRGIDLNKPIVFKHSSLRFFAKGEHHVSRLCEDDVLLMVYEGVLRFSEDGIQYEIHPGEYHIQKHNSRQAGEYASDQPRYLYVHFYGDWNEGDNVLPADGIFDYTALRSMIVELDAVSHSGAPYITKAGKFYNLLSSLNGIQAVDSLAQNVSDFLSREFTNQITLQILSEKFNFSKNHIVNTFKKNYGITPIAYIIDLRLKKAEYLLEVTSDPIETISSQCGFECYSNFYKLFVRKNQLTPQKWREYRRMGPAGRI